MIWHERILEEIDQDQLEKLCNPVKMFHVEDDEVFFFFVLMDEGKKQKF